MVHQPSMPKPHLCSIDGNALLGNTFSVVINPRDVIKKYTITICRTDQVDYYIVFDKTYEEDEDYYFVKDGKCYYFTPTKDISTNSAIVPSDDMSEATIYKIENKDDPVFNNIIETVSLNVGRVGERLREIKKMDEYIYENTVEFEAPNYLYGSSDGGTVLQHTVPSIKDEETDEKYIENGRDYYWFLELWNIYDEKITTSNYFFSAKGTPKINLVAPSIIESSEHEFTASFSQSQNEAYLNYKFSLYLDDMLIDKTEEKIDSKISYKYSGFLPNNTYRIDLEILMNDRTSYIVSRCFRVKYDLLNTNIIPTVTVDKNKTCINIDCSKNISVMPTTSNETVEKITFQTNTNPNTNEECFVANIPYEQYVEYESITSSDSIDIDEDNFTIHLHVNFLPFFNGNIIELSNNEGSKYIVGYDSESFYYQIPGKEKVTFDPYLRTASCVQDKTSVDDDTLYVLNDEDEIWDDSVIVFNDIASKFWWHITLLPDKVLFERGERYDNTVVT